MPRRSVSGVQTPDALAANRALWESMAAVHGEGRDTIYDVDGLVAGGPALLDAERDALQAALAGRSLDGLDVLHVQCHLAFDAVELARNGARVTGVDFSPTALAKAADIAARAGVSLELVEADVTDLPASLHGRFDLAWATIGVVAWIEDLDAWAQSLAATLRPGGRLVLVELHPLFTAVGSVDPLVFDWPYADTGPLVESVEATYAGAELDTARTAVEHAHSLGEVVSSVVRAGLHVLRLDEHDSCELDPRGVLPREPDGRYRLRSGRAVLPLLYTLIAER